MHDGHQNITLAISGDSLVGEFRDAAPRSIGPDGKVIIQVSTPYRPDTVYDVPATVIGYRDNLSVLRYDSTLPTIPETRLGLLRYLADSDQGFIAADIGSGLLTDRGGDLEIVLPSGTPIKSSSEPLSLVHVSGTQPPVIDDLGRFAFVGTAGPPGSDIPTLSGVFQEMPEGVRLIANRGGVAPVEGSLGFLTFGDLQSNGSGHLTFSAGLGGTNPPVNALWAVNPDGSLRLVASGSPQYPVANGVYFNHFEFEPPRPGQDLLPSRPFNRVINEEGRVAFAARSAVWDDGFCQFCIWSEGRTGELEQIIAAGDPVNGAPGSLFAGANRYDALSMNATGQLAVVASLTGDSSSAVLLADPRTGVLTAVVKSGDVLSVPDATGAVVPRVVERVSSPGTEFLNDRGEVLVYALFTDGTWGLFVASIPEPSTGVATAMVLALVAMRRHSPAV